MTFKKGDMVMYNFNDTALNTLHYGLVGVVQRRVIDDIYDVKWQSLRISWYALEHTLKKIKGDSDVQR
jgi:hypothetical protein